MENSSKNNFIDDILDDIERNDTSLSQRNENNLVVPNNDESLLSWLVRIANSYELSLKEYLKSERDYLARNHNYNAKLSSNWSWIRRIDIFSNPFIDKILIYHSLKPRDLTLVDTINKLGSNEKQLRNNVQMLSKYYYFSLRICPICWKQKSNRYFKKSWRFPHFVICQEHGVSLIEKCPNCHQKLFANPQYFRKEWFYKCQHCGQNYLDFPYSQENILICKIQILILASFNENDISIFIDEFSALNIPVVQLHSFSQILRKIVGYKGIVGLIVAIFEIYSYFRREEKVPTYRDGFHGVSTALGRGEWAEYNISTWNDLLQMVLDTVNVERGKYKGKDGFEKAISEMKEFFNHYNRLPTNREQKFLGISNALYKGEWKKLGCSSWNDLLIKAFGKINVKMNYYNGEEGLKRAIKLLNDLYQKSGKIPTSTLKAVKGILTAISRGEWEDQEIKTWNDLLLHVFGKLNQEINKYGSEESFKTIVNKLENFRSTYNRLPTVSDQGMGEIAAAAYRKRFVKYRVSSWNDLLGYVFGEINFVGKDAYHGKKGLECAKHKLNTFFSHNRFQPTPNSKGMSRLAFTIKEGNFSEFKINTWEELLVYIFSKAERRNRS